MTNEALNEIQVLQSCAAGDAAAFEMIVQKYQSLVCAITYSAVGQVDKSEELAQQAFINAWKNLHQLEDFNHFKAWLVSITRNAIRTFFRTQKRDIVNNAAPIDRIGDTADDSTEPLDTIITREQEAIVRQSLQQIPEKYREPMVLFYRQQQSTRQVAEALDLTEETVRTRLLRGRKLLKEQVAHMIEGTLSHTGPGKAFTAMVVASIAGLALTGSTASAATGTAAGTTAGSTSAGITTVMSTVTAKIITAAAVVAVGIGAVFTYQHFNTSEPDPSQSRDIAMVQDEHQPVVLPENTDTVHPEVSDVVAADSIEKTETQIAALHNNLTLTDVPETEPVSISQITEIPEPAEYVFEPNGVLSGIITDAETGQPVTDATVTISPGRLYRTQTDDRGYYSFESIEKSGDFTIGIHSKEYVGLTDSSVQPKMHLMKQEQTVKHFQLPRACMIDLYVVDEDGNPVQDARVWATSLAEENGRKMGPSYVSQQTDENGYILLGGFPPSDKPYVITSIHTVQGERVWSEKFNQEIRESILDFAPGYLKVTLQDPGIIEYGEIVMRKGIQLHGTATYSDGTPAAECEIVPYPDWWHSTTSPPSFAIDPNGTFTLDHIIPGSYRIQGRIPTGQSSAIGMGLFNAHLPSEKDKLLDVTIPRKPTNEDSLNEPLEVKLYGMVIDAETGKPIPEFRLRYRRFSSSYYGGDGKWTQFNNDAGDFNLEVIGSQHVVCKIQAVAKGYAPQWSEEVNTENNKAVLIKLAPGGSIAGRVVDADGKPIADAEVLPYSLAGTERDPSEPLFVSQEGAVTTNQAGLFTLDNIAPGTETLKISHPEFTYTLVPDIEVKQAQKTDIGKIILHQGGIVEGIVYDHQGNPLPEVTLYAQNHFAFSSSEIQYATAMTDPNGFFHIEKLPSEMVYIVRPRAYEHTGVVSRGVIPAQNTVTQLDFGGGPVIEGRIIIDGQPLKNNQLMLTLGQSSDSGLFRSHAETDENGRFKMPAGLPGTYTLTYNQKSELYTSNPIKLLDIIVGSNDIDLGIIPGYEHILNADILVPDEPSESIQFFYLVQDDPLEGPRVFWKDQPMSSQMPYSISIPRPGLYYAVVRYGDFRGEYRYPIDIQPGQKVTEIQIPFQPGNVTLSGKLPEQINHVWFTNQEHTISGILYNSTTEDGAFRIDGLLPGVYYFSPKWRNYDDSIKLSIPNVSEFPLTLDLTLLQDLLKERVSVRVFDPHGLPVENATVWMESNGTKLPPATVDHCSSVFYLLGGDYVIHAEKESTVATRAYQVCIDKSNTASGESYETYIQLKPGT